MPAGPSKIEHIVKNDSLNDMIIDIMSCDKYINQTSDRGKGVGRLEVVSGHDITAIRARSPSSPPRKDDASS